MKVKLRARACLDHAARCLGCAAVTPSSIGHETRLVGGLPACCITAIPDDTTSAPGNYVYPGIGDQSRKVLARPRTVRSAASSYPPTGTNSTVEALTGERMAVPRGIRVLCAYGPRPACW